MTVQLCYACIRDTRTGRRIVLTQRPKQGDFPTMLLRYEVALVVASVGARLAQCAIIDEVAI